MTQKGSPDERDLLSQSIKQHRGPTVLSKKIIATIVISLGVAGAAQASIGRPYTVLNGYGQSSTPTMSAPEIDPASAFSALSFLAGGLAVIRGRRVKK